MLPDISSAEEKSEYNVYNAIGSIMTDKIMLQAGQRSDMHYNIYLTRYLKEILSASKRLKKLKHPLKEETILEMIESVIYPRTVPDPSEFLNVVYSEHLEGTAEEKEAIIAQINLSELKNDTFTLVTRYLKNNGFLKKKKKKKGFNDL